MQTPAERPSLLRSDSRVIAGVCGGLAEHLGVRVSFVRVAFIALVGLGGAGVVLYAWLWAMTPSKQEADADAERSRGTRRLSLAEEMERVQRNLPKPAELSAWLVSIREVLIGATLLVLAFLAYGQWAGWTIRWDLLWPSLGILAGVVLAWLQLDGSNARREGKLRGPVLLRLALGLLLVISGLLALVSGNVSTVDLLGGLATAGAILAGTVVVLLPWALRLWRDFLSERSSRQAAAQRAEFAAHLHDSVLQTLAVIQKRSDDPAAVRTLARVQERELRQWLYGDPEQSPEDLGTAITEEARTIEQLMLRDIEVITVGHAQGIAAQQALVAASGEAMMNAAKHTTGKISVFVECTPSHVEIFVRDRGSGFDVQSIAADRHGVRESIIGRIERAGGTVTIRSSSEGTEVQLRMPREESTEEGTTP
ncbi:PspC domain-containing protein [Glutamicibacter endophyticus]|uniref:ATP-binding protein n=1 Tax=Glutamicibacter endophyticus TaxID=1522174 RepID=UPI003AEF1C07